jgi:hypothetical protein
VLYQGSLRIDLQPNQLNQLRLEREKEIADLSTTLRSGRDDNSVAGRDSVFPGEVRGTALIAFKMNCHLDRSGAEWRDLRFLQHQLVPAR